MQPMNNNFFQFNIKQWKIPEIAFHSLFPRPIYTKGSPCLSVKSISKYFTSLAIQNLTSCAFKYKLCEGSQASMLNSRQDLYKLF